MIIYGTPSDLTLSWNCIELIPGAALICFGKFDSPCGLRSSLGSKVELNENYACLKLRITSIMGFVIICGLEAKLEVS